MEKVFKLDSEVTIDEVCLDNSFQGSLFLVNGTSFLAQAIKVFQNEDENLKDVYLELNDHLLADKLADFNHIGLIIKDCFEQSVTWKRVLFNDFPTIKLTEVSKMTTFVNEEVQFEGKSIKATNLFSDILGYKDELAKGEVKNIIIAKPKFTINVDDLLNFTKKSVGKYKYNYLGLIGFALYYNFKKWFTSTDNTRDTCSEYVALTYKTLCSQWLEDGEGENDSDDNMYKEIVSKLDKVYEQSPIAFFLLSNCFDWYICNK